MRGRYRGIKLRIRRRSAAPVPDTVNDWSRFRRQILLVCHGNRCRSPFAAALLAQRLPADTWRVFSAGVEAVEGKAATMRSLHVARDFDIDLSTHRARRLAADQVRYSGLIFTMSRLQAEQAACLERDAASRIRLLGAYAPAANLWSLPADPMRDAADEEEISDPVGQSSELHRQCFERIELAVDQLADWLLRGAVPARGAATADGWLQRVVPIERGRRASR